MNMITDARGNAFPLSLNPKRIVSLVPSTTETLYSLGLGENIVGITRYCVHPPIAKANKTVIGGTKKINFQKIQSQKPDIVLGNQEENSKEIFQRLQELGIPSYIAFPQHVNEALLDLKKMGILFQREQQANHWIDCIKHNRSKCSSKPFRYAYIIWRKPWMSLNDQTFISSMLKEIGGENVFAQQSERYFTCSLTEIVDRQPDVVLLSSEPYPFQQKHIQEFVEAGFQPEQIQYIDGEMCSWHGVRMVEAFPYLQKQRASWF